MERVYQTFKGKDLSDLLIKATEQQESAETAGLADICGFEASYDSEENEWTVIQYSHV